MKSNLLLVATSAYAISLDNIIDNICDDNDSLCSPLKSVSQKLPTEKASKELVEAVCKEHPESGCGDSVEVFNYQLQLISLCQIKPEVKQCCAFVPACTVIAESSEMQAEFLNFCLRVEADCPKDKVPTDENDCDDDDDDDDCDDDDSETSSATSTATESQKPRVRTSTKAPSSSSAVSESDHKNETQTEEKAEIQSSSISSLETSSATVTTTEPQSSATAVSDNEKVEGSALVAGSMLSLLAALALI